MSKKRAFLVDLPIYRLKILAEREFIEMKKLKDIAKSYKLSLIIGIVAIALIVVFALIGMIGKPALLIPFRSVLSSGKGWGYTTTMKEFLRNIVIGIGVKAGWHSSFAKVVIAAGFWVDLLLCVVFVVKAIRNGEKKRIAPVILLWLTVVGLLYLLEVSVYGAEVGALARRATLALVAFLLLGVIALIALFAAYKAGGREEAVAEEAAAPAVEEKKEEVDAAKKEEVEALEKKVADLEKKIAALEKGKADKGEVVAPAPTPVVVKVETPAPVADSKLKIERIPFATKLRKADKDLRAKYKELAAYIEDSYGISPRESIAGMTWSAHREKIVFVTVIGKHLRVNFALNADDYSDTKLPVVNSDSKKFEALPLTLKVKSDLSLRRAKALVDDAMKGKGIEKKA